MAKLTAFTPTKHSLCWRSFAVEAGLSVELSSFGAAYTRYIAVFCLFVSNDEGSHVGGCEVEAFRVSVRRTDNCCCCVKKRAAWIDYIR
jgi:hypothetical protein